MYVHARAGLPTGALADPPKAPAADARVLAQAAKLARLMHRAVQDVAASSRFLATAAQRELLAEIVAVLGQFLPTGYGVIDRDGRGVKSARRYRTEVLAPAPRRAGAPFYFHHDTWLFLSFQKSPRAGMQRPFAPGHRCWIHLYAANVGAEVPSLARVLIHETIHMLGHRYRSIEEKMGAAVARATPSPAASALLVRSGFDALRRAMEHRFLAIVEFLNRQPHRAGSGRMTELPPDVAAVWGTHVVEELLAFVFTERATLALATLHASRSRIGISQELVPMQFLKDYLLEYWLKEPKDAAALTTAGGRAVLASMEPDLMRLVDAVRRHVGP